MDDIINAIKTGNSTHMELAPGSCMAFRPSEVAIYLEGDYAYITNPKLAYKIACALIVWASTQEGSM